MLGCGRGHPALGSPATPLRRGGPETSGGLTGSGVGGAGGNKKNCPVETMMKVAFFKSFPLKTRKRLGLSQNQGARGDGPAARGGERGHPPHLRLLTRKGLRSAERLFTGPHARVAYATGDGWGGGGCPGLWRHGLPSPGPSPWPVARSMPGLWGARGWGEAGASPQVTVSAFE